MSIYFKTLKSLALMFLLFTIASVPAFFLFYSGHESAISNVYDTKGIFSTFTLGNLGSSSQICSSWGAMKYGPHELICSFGVMNDVAMFAMADNSTNTCAGKYDFNVPASGIADVAPKCNWTASSNVTSYFEKNCLNQKQCSLNFTK
jgi:hypothetical protein